MLVPSPLQHVLMAHYYIQTVYYANISRITILHTTSALHAERKCTSFFEPSVLQYSHEWTSRRKKLHALFFWYCFRSNYLTVCRNEACNIPLKSYGLGTTSTCWTLFEICDSLIFCPFFFFYFSEVFAWVFPFLWLCGLETEEDALFLASRVACHS